MRKTDINERMKTGFANAGRAAGAGISEDRYDEESGNPIYRGRYAVVRMPSDELTKEERAALNGPVRIIRRAE